jgi:hypothetical protein
MARNIFMQVCVKGRANGQLVGIATDSLKSAIEDAEEPEDIGIDDNLAEKNKVLAVEELWDTAYALPDKLKKCGLI